jgi:hypothetical protein
MNSFRRTEKRGLKTRQKLESEKTRVYAQKPRLKPPFKNSISGTRMCDLLLTSPCSHNGGGRLYLLDMENSGVLAWTDLHIQIRLTLAF